MIIIKYGGSMLNPDEHYSEEAIQKLIITIKTNPEQRFCFIIGGGQLCRTLQDGARQTIKALLPDRQIPNALDEIGIAATKINARYVLSRLQEVFGDEIFPELLVHQPPTPNHRIYLSAGRNPGHTTDLDMMILVKAFGAHKAIKISNFPVVLNVKPQEFDKHKTYESIEKISWSKFANLMGETYIPGGNYPFDPRAAKIGLEVSKRKFTLLIGQYSYLDQMINNKKFVGTIIE